jgi:hypothetical protein
MARRSSSGTGKGASGLPASAGPAPQAQSGGRATKFTGGTGGVPLSKQVTKGAVRAKGVNGVGLDYNVRSTGGDATLQQQGFRVGGSPPLTSGGLQKPIQSLRKILPPWRAGSQS